MSKRKISIIVVVAVLAVAAVVVGVWLLLRGAGGKRGGDKIFVESVAAVTGTGSGVQNRYSGVVEPQKTWEVKKSADKTVKEVFVKEGDQVEAGTPLFEYDTASIKDEIAQAKLELESISNEITDYNNQIADLKKERDQASSDDKFQYTTQIQTVQTSIKQAEYNLESKKVEIQRKEASLDNAVIKSEIAGTVKSISESGYDPYTGNELPFMTILATGEYRVKGTVNEQNVFMIAEGTPVILRSRVDESKTWTGTVKEVDTKTEAKDNNNAYYDESMGDKATKYPFYIELTSTDGLILGQHVYIEMDMGQAEVRDGIWLYSGYVVTDESGSFVWADNGKGRLEKRAVEVGEYDEDTDTYQILSGLTEDDYITYPMDELYEGEPTAVNMSEVSE